MSRSTSIFRASALALLVAAAIGGHARAQSANPAFPPVDLTPPAPAPLPVVAQMPQLTGSAELDLLWSRLDTEERTLKAELDTIGPTLEIAQRRVIARGRVYYRYVRAGLLPAGGGFDALVDHAARVERTRMAVERDLQSIEHLGKRAEEIQNRLARLRAERAPLDAQREALLKAKTVIAEADERRAAFARAFETSNRPDSVAIYGADIGPVEADASTGFRQLKGRLRFPVAGRAEVHRVRKKSAAGPGLELAGALGSAVRSVAAGRVAFADRYDEYGLTVIIDHGDHYYTVYGSLGGADVKAGESIQSGARIGSVGSEGGKPPMLYFELRHKSDTIDPGPWLGL